MPLPPSSTERHGKVLGPGQYNPQFPKGIELRDVTRPSSTFKSTTGRLDPSAQISTPGPAKAGRTGPDPGEHDISAKAMGTWPELDKDPHLETSAFSNAVPRFTSKPSLAANTKTEERFSPSDLDPKKWSEAQTEFPTKSRRKSIFPAKEHHHHWSRRGCAADKVYDPHPNMSTNVFVKQRTARNNATNFSLSSARWDSDSRRTKRAADSGGPGKYRPKSTGDMQVSNSRHSYHSQFKSRVDRFDGPGSYLKTNRKLVDFWGWNYTHKSVNSRMWSAPGSGGNFARNCSKSRFAKPYFAAR